jgi:hypothetical protein
MYHGIKTPFMRGCFRWNGEASKSNCDKIYNHITTGAIAIQQTARDIGEMHGKS